MPRASPLEAPERRCSLQRYLSWTRRIQEPRGWKLIENFLKCYSSLIKSLSLSDAFFWINIYMCGPFSRTVKLHGKRLWIQEHHQFAQRDSAEATAGAFEEYGESFDEGDTIHCEAPWMRCGIKSLAGRNQVLWCTMAGRKNIRTENFIWGQITFGSGINHTSILRLKEKKEGRTMPIAIALDLLIRMPFQCHHFIEVSCAAIFSQSWVKIKMPLLADSSSDTKNHSLFVTSKPWCWVNCYKLWLLTAGHFWVLVGCASALQRIRSRRVWPLMWRMERPSPSGTGNIGGFGGNDMFIVLFSCCLTVVCPLTFTGFLWSVQTWMPLSDFWWWYVWWYQKPATNGSPCCAKGNTGGSSGRQEFQGKARAMV